MIVNKSQSPLLNYNIVRDWSKEAGDHTAELGALLQRVFVLISALGKGEKAISLPAAGLYSEVLTEWMKGWNIGHPACTGGSCSIQDRETAPSDNRDLPTIADALRGHPTPPGKCLPDILPSPAFFLPTSQSFRIANIPSKILSVQSKIAPCKFLSSGGICLNPKHPS